MKISDKNIYSKHFNTDLTFCTRSSLCNLYQCESSDVHPTFKKFSNELKMYLSISLKFCLHFVFWAKQIAFIKDIDWRYFKNLLVLM